MNTEGENAKTVKTESDEDEVHYKNFSKKADQMWRDYAGITNGPKKSIKKAVIFANAEIFSNLHLVELAYPPLHDELNYKEFIKFIHNYYALAHPEEGQKEEISSTSSSSSTDHENRPKAKKRKSHEVDSEVHEKISKYFGSLGDVSPISPISDSSTKEDKK